MALEAIELNLKVVTYEPIAIKRPTTFMSDKEIQAMYHEDYAAGEKAGMAGFVEPDVTFTVNGMWAFALGYSAGQAYKEKMD